MTSIDRVKMRTSYSTVDSSQKDTTKARFDNLTGNKMLEDVIQVGPNITLDGRDDGYVEIRSPASFSLIGNVQIGLGRNRAGQPEAQLAPDLTLPISDAAGQEGGVIQWYFGLSGSDEMYVKLYGNDDGASRQFFMLPTNLDNPVVGDAELWIGSVADPWDKIYWNGEVGFTGTFTEHTGKTVTVKNGIIISVV